MRHLEVEGLGLVDGVLGDRPGGLRGGDARRLDGRVGLLDGVREQRLVELLHEHRQARGGPRLRREPRSLGGRARLVDGGGEAVVAAAVVLHALPWEGHLRERVGGVHGWRNGAGKRSTVAGE